MVRCRVSRDGNVVKRFAEGSDSTGRQAAYLRVAQATTYRGTKSGHATKYIISYPVPRFVVNHIIKRDLDDKQ